MPSNVEVNNLPPVVPKNKEAIQQLERDRWDSEEIHGSDRFAMIAKKGQPAPGPFRVFARSFHPTGNTSFRYLEAQHEQFTVDAWSAHVGFSAIMRKITSRTPFDRLCLPTCFFTLEIKRQETRNPARCQRTTVSGVTISSDFFQPDQKQLARTQKNLSREASLGRGFQVRNVTKFVTDMDKAVKFYRDVLGLQVKFESPGWSEFVTGKTTLTLHPASDRNPAGQLQLADVEAFYRDLSANGVAFRMPPKKQDFGGPLAQFVDSKGAACSVSAEVA